MLTLTLVISDQLDTSCLPPFMFSMKWWAKIGVTKQYIMNNACSELFPELGAIGCGLKMFAIGFDFVPHVQTLLAVLSEKETYLKSKFCDFHYDIFDIPSEKNRTDCDRCISAKSTINLIGYRQKYSRLR